jgi:hypothetical protein
MNNDMLLIEEIEDFVAPDAMKAGILAGEAVAIVFLVVIGC